MSILERQAAEHSRAYFGPRLRDYGDDPRGVDWQSTAAQEARFAALLQLGDLNGASVLDAGCGLGHLYGYLHARGIEAQYTGCDVSAEHIAVARASYPQGHFVVGEAGQVVAGAAADYVIACGLLHLRVPRWQRWAWGLVQTMYRHSRRGLAFTLPQRGYGHPPIIASIDSSDWAARLRELGAYVEVTTLEPWGDAVFLLRKERP